LRGAALALVVVTACGSRTRHAEPAPPANAAPPASLPLPAGTHLPCDQVLDPTVFTDALAESAPIALRDDTASDVEAVASCGLIRGGPRLDDRELAQLIKNNGRLGTLPGDELCRVTVYCTRAETEAAFRERCRSHGNTEDASVGSVACRQVLALGVDDVSLFQLLDEDTGCVLAVRGGPSMIDNDVIETCARTARTHLTPSRLGAR
jgi:hypothetical protein